ncbi:GP46-like surface antigen, putative [Bodo saltans]|uniref:GP46-like surface antigen, putative n=1 Tax=Bodo saltans TaxID=75058 RepID=A0A0S4JRN5_BODSA|nr:GP46-like surface antigen, putative [Bodo saltans]|eukprot:CUG92850.1 GP46-like surface antigen, putative [Bodo saltans]
MIGVAVVAVAMLCVMNDASDTSGSATAVRDALARLYNATNGSGWKKATGWKSQGGTSHCDWYGITCSTVDNTTTVTEIHLSRNNLRGTLPSDASFWETFANLTVLSIASNQVNGTFPNVMPAACPMMLRLNMSHNALEGTLPASIPVTAWRALDEFDVSYNLISGSLPLVYVNLSSIQQFRVNNNLLTGTLPKEYAKLTTMEHFSVGYNNLTGTLPDEYRHWVNLTLLRVEWNFLNGTLPPSYASWKKLGRFRVAGNAEIGGTLPAEFGAWTKLVEFYATGLSLQGTLPDAYSAMTSMQVFSVFNNYLTGTLPDSYARWGSSILFFQVLNNPLNGTLPSSYGLSFSNITTIIITNTSISGTIPAEWGNMKTLTVLMLHVNRLNGTLPESLGDLKLLTSLTLADNDFSGVVPFDAWSTLRNVQLLLLGDNPRLNGLVPTSFQFIFTPTSLFSVCRSNVCGPRLPMVVFGYGCMPQYVLRDHTITDISEGISIVSPRATFLFTAPCTAPISPPPHHLMQTTSRTVIDASAPHDDGPLWRRAQGAGSAAPFFTLASAVVGPISNAAGDLQMLAGIMKSSCMCGVSSSSSAMQYSVSPFAGLSRLAVVLGNVGLTAAMALIQWTIVKIAHHHSSRSSLNKKAFAKGPTTTLRDTSIEAKGGKRSRTTSATPLPHSLKTIRQLEAALQFPNVSLRVAFLLLPGVLASSCDILFTYSSTTTTPAEVVAAVFGFLYTAVVLVAVEVLVFQCRVLAVPLRFVAINFAELLPAPLGSLSRRKKISDTLLPRGTWEPKSHACRFGCIVSGLRGGCEQLWRFSPLLNITVQMLSAVPANGSVGCGVIQLLTALFTATLGFTYALKQPTRVWFASIINAFSLCLTASLTISGMLCREGIVSEDAVLRIGLAVSIVGMLSSVYSVLVRASERWLIKRKEIKGTSGACVLSDVGLRVTHHQLESPHSRCSQHELVLTPEQISCDACYALEIQNASVQPSRAMASLRPVVSKIVLDTRVERLEELITQICSNGEKRNFNRRVSSGADKARQ